MRSYVGVTVLAILSGCATSTSDHPAQQQPVSFEEGLRMMRQGNAQKEAIHSFVKLAAAGNLDGLVQAFDPAARRGVGEPALREFLTNTIIPFFAEYQAVDGYETVNPAGFPDGRTGLIHYTYIVTKNETRKPFAIALISDASATHVVNVTVNECVKGRHPVSKGRCD